MRLDLFLKESRLIKRRSQANLMCSSGKVRVNNNPGKPSKDIKVGDRIEITYPERMIIIEVLSLLTKGVPKSEALKSYRILTEKEISIWD